MIYFFTGSLFLVGPNTIQMLSSSSQHVNPVSWLCFNMKVPLTRMHCLLYFQVFFSFLTWYTQTWADLKTYLKISLYYLSLKLAFAFYPHKVWQWPVPWQRQVNSELWTELSFTFSFFQSLCLLYSDWPVIKRKFSPPRTCYSPSGG